MRERVQILLLEREAEGRPKMVRTHDWEYVYDPLDPDGIAELYDLRSDPWELTNLAASTAPEHQAARRMLEQLLLNWSISTEDTQPVPFACSRSVVPSSRE
jgi:arylsulfatase A-like enzyme